MTEMKAAVDALLEESVAAGDVPGVAAVVCGPDGVRYEGRAGRLGIEDGAGAVEAGTVFRIASMTKALVSGGALGLLERDAIELDQPVADVLPEFADLPVLEGFDGEEPRLRAPTGQATIGQLLTHTAGHGYWFANELLLRYHEATGTPTSLEGRRACLSTPLVNDPGTRWEYGTNVDWLGQVIEAVSGRDLDRHLREHLFEPLGMADATFRPSAEQRTRLMALHQRRADGSLVPSEVDLPAEPEFWPGGHGAYATARDWARFMSAVLAGGELGGERILAPETVELLFTDHLDGATPPGVLRSAVPELTNDTALPPGRQGWGLGLHLTLDGIEGMRRPGTGGWAGLFNCYFWIDPAADVAGAIFTQVLPFFDARIVGLAERFEQAVYA